MDSNENRGTWLANRRKAATVAAIGIAVVGALTVAILLLWRRNRLANSPSWCAAQFVVGIVKGDQTLIKEYANQRNLDYLELHGGTIPQDTRTFLASLFGVDLTSGGAVSNERGVRYSVKYSGENAILSTADGHEAYRMAFSDVRRNGSEATVRLETFRALFLDDKWEEEPRPSNSALFKMESEDGRWKPKSAIVALQSGQDEIPMDFAALAQPAEDVAGEERVTDNEARACGNLVAINTGAVEYEQTYKCGYPSTLAVLGPPPRGQSPSANAAGLVDDRLAAGKASGYTIVYVAGPKDERGCVRHYIIKAEPTEPGITGNKFFYTDDSNVVREQEGRPADRNSPPLSANP